MPMVKSVVAGPRTAPARRTRSTQNLANEIVERDIDRAAGGSVAPDRRGHQAGRLVEAGAVQARLADGCEQDRRHRRHRLGVSP